MEAAQHVVIACADSADFQCVCVGGGGILINTLGSPFVLLATVLTPHLWYTQLLPRQVQHAGMFSRVV